MPIVVNSNPAATTAAFNLSKNHANLSKSLARLSSGNRITQPAEDAGGLAVAYKLDSHVKRTEAVLNNHQNSLSFLQVQDGALETVGNIVSRMAELRTMAADITKNSSDIENYSKEFRELQVQLKQISAEKFNGISLFSVTGGQTNTGTLTPSTETYRYRNSKGVSISGTYTAHHRTLTTHPSGVEKDGSIELNVSNLSFILSLGAIRDSGGTNVNLLGLQATSPASQTAKNSNGSPVIDSDGFIFDITGVSINQFTHVIEKIADARAENGAEQQRVQQSFNLHSLNMVNLEAAHGRIMDVDVALESTRFAKHNVLVQASASMTAQANQLTQVALTLLQ
jgi:flagellin